MVSPVLSMTTGSGVGGMDDSLAVSKNESLVENWSIEMRPMYHSTSGGLLSLTLSM